jgi:hypothetical protein
MGVAVGGSGVLVAVGASVPVAVGTGVLVAGGMGVLVAGGMGVLVAGGMGVLVAGGGDVGVGTPLWNTVEAGKRAAETGSTRIALITSNATIKTGRDVSFIGYYPPNEHRLDKPAMLLPPHAEDGHHG